MRLFRAGIVLSALMGPAVAQAQAVPPRAVDPASAAALQTEIRSWMTWLIGPPAQESPLRVMVEDNHFRVALALDSLLGLTKAEASVALRPLEDGRWSIDRLVLPNGGRVSSMSSDKSRTPSGFAFSVGTQDARATIDPALKSRSSAEFELRDVEIKVDDPSGSQEQSFERYAGQGTLTPGADGKLDLRVEGSVGGWHTIATTNDGQRVAMEIRRTRATARLDGLSRPRIEEIAAIGQRGGASQPKNSDAYRTDLQAALTAFLDLFSRLELEQSVDDLSIEIPGIGEVSLEEMRTGMGLEIQGGLLRAWIDMAIEGVEIPGLPKELASLVPSKLSMRPVIAGINRDKLARLITDNTTNAKDSKAIEAASLALFTADGAFLGVEALTLELDPLRLSGSARLRLTPSGKGSVEGQLSSTGLDDLIAEARKKPELRDVMPIAIMLRGLARIEGPRMTWAFTASEDQVIVNGVDLATMAGNGKQGAQPPAKGNKR